MNVDPGFVLAVIAAGTAFATAIGSRREVRARAAEMEQKAEVTAVDAAEKVVGIISRQLDVELARAEALRVELRTAHGDRARLEVDLANALHKISLLESQIAEMAREAGRIRAEKREA